MREQKRGTEAAIANYGRTTSNPRTQRVSNSDTIEFQKNRNNSLASDNFEISLDDELDKFMTPRDVREKMILSQMVGVEQKEALEAQEREKGRVAYFDNTNPNKSNTPSTESDKSFVGLLNDKLYDMIKELCGMKPTSDACFKDSTWTIQVKFQRQTFVAFSQNLV